MIMGSPLAASVSGPAVAEMNAICLPSGDHATRSPADGNGWLVPCTGAMNVGCEPSARTVIKPDWPDWPDFSPTRPKQAIKAPSGDHRAPPDAPSICVALPVETSISHSCEYGAPGRSLIVTLYAMRVPSGENCVSATERSR